jgi:hypothetical protein
MLYLVGQFRSTLTYFCEARSASRFEFGEEPGKVLVGELPLEGTSSIFPAVLEAENALRERSNGAMPFFSSQRPMPGSEPEFK